MLFIDLNKLTPNFSLYGILGLSFFFLGTQLGANNLKKEISEQTIEPQLAFLIDKTGNSNAYLFNLPFLPTDTDGDGIPDIDDLDDDNDGILDVSECPGYNLILSEDFGAGVETSTVYTTYLYDPIGIVNDGEYTIVQNTIDAANFPSWSVFTDHTGNPGGRMMIVNASYTPDELYRRTVPITPNSNITVDFWLRNILKIGSNSILPNVGFRIEDNLGNILGQAGTGPVLEDENWHNYLLTIFVGNNTSIDIVLFNIAPGGAGNDLALDDITIIQNFCDYDGDGIANVLDLDSDNDGCPDYIEGGGTFDYQDEVQAGGILTDGNGGIVTVNLGNSVGTTPGTDIGIPTIAGTGQGIGASQDTVNTSLCCNFSVSFKLRNVSCDSVDNAYVTAENYGGVLPITYKWDSGQTAATVSNLATGYYEVTLTDRFGCQSKARVQIEELNCPPPCPTNPCAEAIVDNTDICVLLTNSPSDPLDSLDCDRDGVINLTECIDSTDPLDPCDFVQSSITLPVTADQSNCPVPCPDLTPVVTVLPGNIAGLTAVEVAIQLTEINGLDTDGSVISVRVPADPRLLFVWNIGLTQAALVPVQNSDWNYLGNNSIFHTWTYNGSGLVIPANGVTAFGFQSFYDPQSTDGQTTLTATIIPFSGSECKILNNTDSERMVYFK